VTSTAIVGFDDGEHQGILAAQQRRLAIGVRRNRYLVMFTIDGSGSMSGSRWQHVRRAINMFIGNLSDDDMISTIIFND
jgi:Mg-chelatase subunit ChlD